MSTPNWWGDWRPILTPHTGNLQPTDLLECTSIVGGLPVNTAITGAQIIAAASGGGATWGSITGTLSAQTDLQSALNAKENTITAGTTSQYYRGDKTFQTLDKTAVGLGNVDNTSDLNKPISTATQTALNAKQNTLTLTTTGTSGAATLVGSTLNIPQYSGGGGGGGIGGLQAFFPVSGNVLPSVPYGGLFGSAMIPDRVLLYAFVPSQNFTTSALRINVTAAVVGANARILIYSNTTGTYRPNSKILESTNLNCGTTGEKSFLYSATFIKGEVYWISVYSNLNPSISHASAGNLFILRQEQGNAMQSIEAVYTFGTAPSIFPTVVGYNNRNCPNVGFVIA